jgi:hypothetical protein
MKFFLALLLPFSYFIACNNSKHEKETPAGGPCSYKEEAHPAKLISLVTIDSTNYDALFEVSTGLQVTNKPDTMRFHFLNNTYIKGKQIKADSIAVGKIYKLIDQRIVSGTCNPHIQTIRLEKY